MPDVSDVLLQLLAEGGKAVIHHGGQAIASKTYAKTTEQQGTKLAELPKLEPLPGLSPLEDPRKMLESTERGLSSPESVLPPLDDAQHLQNAQKAPVEEAKESKRDVSGSYADEWGEDLSIACAACTMRHEDTVVTALDTAANSDSARERKKNSAVAAGEILVWLRYDMTEEKLARTPPDKLAAVMEAKRHLAPLVEEMPRAPEKMVLSWAAVGEALRFANSARPKPTDRKEVEVRMVDVNGMVGYLESTMASDPNMKGPLSQVREARHAWTGGNYSPEALSFAYGKLEAVVVELTPDPGKEKAQELHKKAKDAQQAFYGAFFHGMKQKRGPSTYKAPTKAEAKEVLVKKSSRHIFDNLEAFGRRIGVPVSFRNLPEGVEGEYSPEPHPGTVLLSAAALAKDPYYVGVEAHELTHAQLHNLVANVYNSSGHEPEEREAELAEIATVALLDLPITFYDGSTQEPTAFEVDWADLRKSVGDEMAGRVETATNILVKAGLGDVEGAAKDYEEWRA